jgi:hypothetical protein
MQPIYFEGDHHLLMIVPDSNAHVDGHPVLTYTYAIYKDVEGGKAPRYKNTDALLSPDKKEDPNFWVP